MTVGVRRQGNTFEIVDQAPWSLDANRFLHALNIRGLSPATIRAYAYDLVSLSVWMREAQLDIHELTHAALLRFVEAQRNVHAKPTSINRRLITCAQFFRFVCGHEMPKGTGSSIPAPHYKGRGRDRSLGLHQVLQKPRAHLRVKVPRKLVEPLTAAQVTAFIHSLKHYRDLAIVYLMLFCGLRSAETLALNVTDVDLQSRQARVCGKGRKERMVPLPPALNSVFGDYLRLERPSKPPISQRMFVVLQGSHRGRPMTAAGLRNLFRHRRRAQAALHNANAHRFRHTFGADMARAGVSLAVLQRLMGHADPQTTLQYINLSMADIAVEFERASQTIATAYERTA